MPDQPTPRTEGTADPASHADPRVSPGMANATSIVLEIGLCTHRGKNANRPVNEDSVLGYRAASPAADGVCGVAAVADGMGGGDFGEDASELALQSVADSLCSGRYLEWAAQRRLSPSLYDHATKDLAKDINRLLLDEGARRGRQGKMCTTFDLLLVTPQKFFIAHAGDSAVWLVTDAGVRKLTEDHALASGDPLDEGTVTNILGLSSGVRVDPISEELAPSMTFVLTSDGAHRSLREATLVRCLNNDSAQKAAEDLVRLAVKRDGTDNASVAIVRVLPRGSSPGTFPANDPCLLPRNNSARRSDALARPPGSQPSRAPAQPEAAPPSPQRPREPEPPSPQRSRRQVAPMHRPPSASTTPNLGMMIGLIVCGLLCVSLLVALIAVGSRLSALSARVSKLDDPATGLGGKLDEAERRINDLLEDFDVSSEGELRNGIADRIVNVYTKQKSEFWKDTRDRIVNKHTGETALQKDLTNKTADKLAESYQDNKNFESGVAAQLAAMLKGDFRDQSTGSDEDGFAANVRNEVVQKLYEEIQREPLKDDVATKLCGDGELRQQIKEAVATEIGREWTKALRIIAPEVAECFKAFGQWLKKRVTSAGDTVSPLKNNASTQHNEGPAAGPGGGESM